MTCGIYKLSFNNTDKVYIGLSSNIERRMAAHKYTLLHNLAPNKLQSAYTKYGMFIPEILCECEESELQQFEIETIDIYNSIENGFNSREGGNIGSSSSTRGDRNGRSIYSNDTIREAFLLLINTNKTLPEISDILNISIQCLGHISSGTGHKWLEKEFPEEYTALVSTKRTYNKYFPVVITNGIEEILINSYEELINKFNIAYSTAVGFISGRTLTLLKEWKLLNKCTSNIKNKKPVYTLKNIYTGYEESFTSAISFFNKYQLKNRNKFNKFLKSNNKEEYEGWVNVDKR